MDEVTLKTCSSCGNPKALGAFYKNGKYGLHPKCKVCMGLKGPKPQEQLDREFRERFWSRVDKDGPVPEHMPHLGSCWVWTGSKHKFGYGFQRFMGKSEVAHRVSWFLEHGVVSSKFVCHRCDNPGCVRPSHLWEGTCGENQKDMADKGRGGSPGFQGITHPMAALNEADVYEIRKLWDEKCGQAEIAKQFGISRIHAARIGRRRSWPHLPERS